MEPIFCEAHATAAERRVLEGAPRTGQRAVSFTTSAEPGDSVGLRVADAIAVYLPILGGALGNTADHLRKGISKRSCLLAASPRGALLPK